MNEIEIIKAENPERYGFIFGKYIILCQIENDDYTLSIIKSRNGKRPSYKVKVLYEGNTDDFCMEYKGQLGYGLLDVEMAFKNFIKNKIL